MNPSPFYSGSAWVLPAVLAITLHEAAHGWMAERFGDGTARSRGRVTFNPLKHISLRGTVLIPGILLMLHSPVLFGYAKPVPVDFRRLKPQRLGMAMVALAGPGMNILLALASALLLHLSPAPASGHIGWWALNFFHALIINCVLALFNMMPILPLDGGRVARAMLPGKIGRIYARTERYGLLLVFALLLVPPLLLGANFVAETLGPLAERLITALLNATGNGEYLSVDL